MKIYAIYLFIVLIGLAFSAFFNPYWLILSSFSLVLAAATFHRFNIREPAVWFLPVITLYHLSIVYLDWFGYRYIENPKEVIMANIVAVIGFIIGGMLNRVLKSKRSSNSKRLLSNKLNYSLHALYSSYIVIILLSLLVNLDFIRSGATTKSEFNNAFGSVFLILILVYFLIVSKKITSDGRISWCFWLFNFIYLLASTLLLGERDIIFSFVLISVVFLFANSILRRKSVLLIVAISLAAIPIMGEYKNLFTKDISIIENQRSFDPGQMLYRLANGEFRSAGYNLSKILAEHEEFKMGATLIGDIGRSFVPGFIYRFENGVLWYNREYNQSILDQGRGYGFSLAAEGYVNFSWFGILLWFFLLSIFIHKLNDLAKRDILYLVIYAFMIPVFIYALRGDFSSVLSPLLKQVIFPMLLILIFDRVLKILIRKE